MSLHNNKQMQIQKRKEKKVQRKSSSNAHMHIIHRGGGVGHLDHHGVANETFLVSVNESDDETDGERKVTSRFLTITDQFIIEEEDTSAKVRRAKIKKGRIFLARCVIF